MHVTTEKEIYEIVKANHLVVLDIYADWCGPCQNLAPHLDEFVDRYNLTLVKVDIEKIDCGRKRDKNGEFRNKLLRNFKVKTIPYVRVWFKGEHVYTGDSSHEKLEEVLKKYV